VHSFVYISSYNREGIDHKLMICYILCKGIGIIGDATTDVFSIVENDFLNFVKSFEIRD
jgi:hypothetical protein